MEALPNSTKRESRFLSLLDTSQLLTEAVRGEMISFSWIVADLPRPMALRLGVDTRDGQYLSPSLESSYIEEETADPPGQPRGISGVAVKYLLICMEAR
ncbi:expressed protein [Echinococcus multilocularis]|uniref:Expressed protein n=1 Tax=Echinococcus multilocularis TaxID=6211 RepID=A0A068Y3V6_ECHMU|nr:expressed protein [Echinococcus multilocularis]